jgi:predicted ATPase
MKQDKTEIGEKFKNWCSNNTATFGSHDMDDFNISWNELDFYDELIEKFNKEIELSKQIERNRVVGIIEEYFEGLLVITIPELTKECIIKKINQD